MSIANEMGGGGAVHQCLIKLPLIDKQWAAVAMQNWRLTELDTRPLVRWAAGVRCIRVCRQLGDVNLKVFLDITATVIQTVVQTCCLYMLSCMYT